MKETYAVFACLPSGETINLHEVEAYDFESAKDGADPDGHYAEYGIELVAYPPQRADKIELSPKKRQSGIKPMKEKMR